MDAQSGGPNPKLVPDGIVGRLTISAIRAFQMRHFGTRLTDGRVDPAGPTMAKLNELTSGDDPSAGMIRCHPAPSAGLGGGRAFGALGLPRFVLAAAGGVSANAANAGPLAQAMVSLPEAVRWVMFAQTKLEFVRAFLSRAAPKSPGAVEQDILKALDTHFHAGTVNLSDKTSVSAFRQRVGLLIIAYRGITTVLNQATTFFAEDLKNTTDFANAVPGGIALRGKILFCQAYLRLGPKFRAAVIVHEAAHFSDAAIGHFASELPAPNGSPVGNGNSKNYAQLSFEEARRNAYSFAQFALHMAEGFDRRLTFPTS